MEINGIISSVRTSRTGSIATVLSDRPMRISSELELRLYDTVSFSIEDGVLHKELITPNGLKITGQGDRADYERAMALLEKHEMRPGRISANEHMETVMAKMSRTMMEVALRIRSSCISGSPMAIRFHSDGDGSSGAIAIYRATYGLCMDGSISWRANKSVAYGMEAFYSDSAFLDEWSSAEKPTVLMIDFGTSKESEGALVKNDGKYAIMCIDHHTLYEGFPSEKFDIYLNPWNNGGNSDTTAGTVAAAIAEMLSGEDMTGLADISMLALLSTTVTAFPRSDSIRS